jgi:hypothetical protein
MLIVTNYRMLIGEYAGAVNGIGGGPLAHSGHTQWPWDTDCPSARYHREQHSGGQGNRAQYIPGRDAARRHRG